MKFQNEHWKGKVMTVRGLIPAEAMGVTLPHEHLLITHQGPEVDLTDVNLAAEELKLFQAAGGHTLADMTNIGLKRDPLALREISIASGIHVIMGCGYYKDAWMPAAVHQQTVDEITQEIVRDITQGVDDTGVQAGVIGEIGVSHPVTPTEKNVLRAAAQAQSATGAAINVHFDIGIPECEYHEALDILESEGANLKRTVVDHLVPRRDQIELCERLAQRGCCIEFDLFGHHIWPKVAALINTKPEEQIASVKLFINQGLLGHILISQDVCHQMLLTANGGNGYGHLLKNVLPEFRNSGLSEAEIRAIMVDNPRRLFPFQ